MAENKFKIFDENATNVQTDAEYATDLQRLDGVTPGKARSVLHNKLFRQVSIMASALGQVIAEGGTEANDSSFTNLVNAIKNTFKKADMVNFDNTGSKLDSINVQNAIVEVFNFFDNKSTIKHSRVENSGIVIPGDSAVTKTIDFGQTFSKLPNKVILCTDTAFNFDNVADERVKLGAQFSSPLTVLPYSKVEIIKEDSGGFSVRLLATTRGRYAFFPNVNERKDYYYGPYETFYTPAVNASSTSSILYRKEVHDTAEPGVHKSISHGFGILAADSPDYISDTINYTLTAFNFRYTTSQVMYDVKSTGIGSNLNISSSRVNVLIY